MLTRWTSRPSTRLSSDSHAGLHARRQVRRIHRDVLKERWRLWGSIALAGLIVAVPLALIQRGDFARGLVVGTLLSATLGTIAFFVVLTGGTAPLMMGELAEQWTAQSLRPLEEHGWHLANHVLLGNRDADHVLVGPGGVLVVETKWRREPWSPTDPNRDAAVHQARSTARSVRHLLGGDVPVQPLVVLWTSADGSGSESLSPRRTEDVLVVPGPALGSWALRRPRGVLDPATVDRLWATVSRHKLSNIHFERENRPVPMSFDKVVLAAFGLALLCLTGFVVNAALLGAVHSLTLWVTVTALLAVGTVGARRHKRWRLPVTAFALGWAGTVALAAVVVGRSVLHL